MSTLPPKSLSLFTATFPVVATLALVTAFPLSASAASIVTLAFSLTMVSVLVEVTTFPVAVSPFPLVFSFALSLVFSPSPEPSSSLRYVPLLPLPCPSPSFPPSLGHFPCCTSRGYHLSHPFRRLRGERAPRGTCTRTHLRRSIRHGRRTPFLSHTMAGCHLLVHGETSQMSNRRGLVYLVASSGTLRRGRALSAELRHCRLLGPG
ncbi:hypothetical protein B0H11DRAFT_830010 [Mycena galericulata]|nr:hypothetical protein B0H11DRAFT_830010 [Mycena galericulata]